MSKTKWGLRIAGIRESGALYPSWYAAKEALYRRALYIQHNAERMNHPRKEEIGVKVRTLLSEMSYAAKRVPREPLHIVLWSLSNPYQKLRLEIGREPY